MNRIVRFQNKLSFKLVLTYLPVLLFCISCSKELSYEAPASTEPLSIFTTQIPGGRTENDSTGGIELGVRFRSIVSGYILGIKFYKTPGNTGLHIAQLYSFDGTLLSSAGFTNETDSGWQTALFTSAIPITANTTYIAAYYSSLGNYTSTAFGFNSAITNGPLIGLADGADGINGLFKYTDSPAFPGLGHLSNNYWVDVLESGNPVE